MYMEKYLARRARYREQQRTAGNVFKRNEYCASGVHSRMARGQSVRGVGTGLRPFEQARRGSSSPTPPLLSLSNPPAKSPPTVRRIRQQIRALRRAASRYDPQATKDVQVYVSCIRGCQGANGLFDGKSKLPQPKCPEQPSTEQSRRRMARPVILPFPIPEFMPLLDKPATTVIELSAPIISSTMEPTTHHLPDADHSSACVGCEASICTTRECKQAIIPAGCSPKLLSKQRAAWTVNCSVIVAAIITKTLSAFSGTIEWLCPGARGTKSAELSQLLQPGCISSRMFRQCNIMTNGALRLLIRSLLARLEPQERE
ncbi:hypothetical protein B0H13DRAFT_1864980 [Mycena leptocephala]|nr:hypothetical protein B0H13DRAFT_1864980 [Mycena leptocephala]